MAVDNKEHERTIFNCRYLWCVWQKSQVANSKVIGLIWLECKVSIYWRLVIIWSYHFLSFHLIAISEWLYFLFLCYLWFAFHRYLIESPLNGNIWVSLIVTPIPFNRTNLLECIQSFDGMRFICYTTHKTIVPQTLKQNKSRK